MPRAPSDRAPSSETGASADHSVPTLSTERLLLRPLVDDDAEMMLALLSEPSFVENIGDRGVRTVEQARTYLRRGPIEMYRREGVGLLHVSLREDGTPIGICGLIRRSTLDHVGPNLVDLGFALFPAFWSRGYAGEAAAVCLEHARTDLGLDRVVAIVQPGNHPSIRLLERLGMGFEQTIDLPAADGSVESLALYGMSLRAGEPADPGPATERSR